ncbi:DUF6538 domain-containing protein [Frigidibacter oleivorans]|uniref:DUF6538 domain-containing protein n=1 Tax=Frigidibacter oleivorans TaxID=2487129 RepID=UPI000F8E2E04|nr:DUF6538 domain-containing protein [Frigidibacter oleivorans]
MSDPILRGSTYHIRKRVPRRYRDVEDRDYVWISLHTDSPEIARRKAPAVWTDMIEAWEAKLEGRGDDAANRMAAARNLAAKRGYRFLSAAEVARLPLPELLDRVEAVVTSKGRLDIAEAEALLGGAKPPRLTVTKALERYWKVAAEKRIGKSADQVRRWENPRKKAVANFVEVIGHDPVVADITTRDLHQFKQWWVDRMTAEGLTPNSANKDMIHLLSVIREVAAAEEIELQFKTDRLMIKDSDPGTRPPFSVTFLRETLLKKGALDGLNPEARAILLGMVNTGYRPSEGASLGPDQIRLADRVPHIRIEPNGRQLKTPNARRVIPLTGVSLEAFKAFPQGFPRYGTNSASLSATVNKFLRENKLLPTDDHSLYSLRHSFEDRMLAAGFDERIKADLMGHSLKRERYGAGANLEHLHRLLKKIAL